MKTLAFIFTALMSGYPALAAADAETLLVQMKLHELGFYQGDIDGIPGPATRVALQNASKAHGFEPNIAGFITWAADKTLQGTKPLTEEDIASAVKETIGDQLKDPFSAQYKNLVKLPSGAICGLVNSKNAYGAYVGWTQFATVGPPLRMGDRYHVISAIIDEPSSDLASLICRIDATGP